MTLVHGSSGYTKGECRCDICAAAHREAQRTWRANARERQARSRANAIAKRQALRNRYADYQPPDVRTYGTSPGGIDYDAAIRAAAVSSVPYPESPNRGTKR